MRSHRGIGGHSGTQSPHAAGQVRGGGVTSALLQEDGNWGGIAHRRPVQCLLNPTPPCDLRLEPTCAGALVVCGHPAGASSEGYLSSGLHRTPCAIHNGSRTNGGRFMQPVTRKPCLPGTPPPAHRDPLQAACVLSCARSKGTWCTRPHYFAPVHARLHRR